MKNKILVIGGTGMVGSNVVAELKNSDEDYVVLSRKKEKAEELEAAGIPTVIGSLGEWDTVKHVFEGINTVFLLSSPAENMLDLHKGAIDMAKNNGVKKIVRLSAEPSNYPEGLYMYEQHAAADEHLKQSGMEYVILKPHYFMQNIAMHAEYIKSNSMFAQYSGDAKIPMIDVRDIAKAAFQALTRNDFNNQTFVLTGPKSISYKDISKNFTDALGRDINYMDISYEDQEAGFKAYGMQEWQLSTVMRLFKKWAEEGAIEPTNDFEKLTNTKATNMEKCILDHIQLFN
ncbi:NAD-dependent epimerase/dehydratase family protein [Labilibacter sediminis]|nr:NAD-dependent epimerase/dehydratase family protein [Labilibacter sediminis]